jgi:hypothetical protein
VVQANLDSFYLLFIHCICIAVGDSAIKSGNRINIGGVMASVLTWSAVDRGFEPRSGETEDYKIGICCFPAKHAALRRKSKD